MSVHLYARSVTCQRNATQLASAIRIVTIEHDQYTRLEEHQCTHPHVVEQPDEGAAQEHDLRRHQIRSSLLILRQMISALHHILFKIPSPYQNVVQLVLDSKSSLSYLRIFNTKILNESFSSAAPNVHDPRTARLRYFICRHRLCRWCHRLSIPLTTAFRARAERGAQTYSQPCCSRSRSGASTGTSSPASCPDQAQEHQPQAVPEAEAAGADDAATGSQTFPLPSPTPEAPPVYPGRHPHSARPTESPLPFSAHRSPSP
ncbi:hypothetical protein B0J12DRAFT_117430 [Macrophomina phaseolina]|uniref:Uncharacterized protein n=1 Tax=Macrophomina phaseolina TaxID=35725 RepID=A0ABQ8FPR6_9PEZI|nr:hypothetical protein B0J12DRAFT_117430 [Macrophomina phaseolina]